ncbi:extracellular solute-binding protein [Actinomyces procaprae]|uniref:ABC transporter substrate-binding protein n=1 Tax=Actinomyces procaprae TaxID=2560010 RepID=UPI00109E30BE|nr:extracellular solute-binding protein [Actinomyces procaprae]
MPDSFGLGLMSSRRQFMSISMVAAVTAVLAACGGSSGGDAAVDVEKQSVGAMDDFTAGTTFKATEPITLSLLWTDWPEYMVTEDSPFMQELQRRTNVSFTLTHIPLSDHEEKRSLLISAGDAPEIIPLVYSGQDAPFVSSGAVLPMSDYLDYMPHFRKLVADWDLQELVDNLKQADGKNYSLPGLQEVSVPVFTVVIRKDVFDEVGAGVPQTWDEMRDALRLIKQRYPDSQPLADGFEGQALLNYAAHAFGAVAGWGFGNGMIDDGTGALTYSGSSDGYKQMLEYFRGLVEEGLLDTESMTTTGTTQTTGTIAEKMANNKVFAASGNSQTVIEFAQAMEGTFGAGKFELLQIAAPGGPAGQIVEPRSFWHGFMLNSSLRDSDHFLATIQFLDWLYYSEEAREFVMWGVEGDTYTKDDEGAITLNPDYSLSVYNINVGAPTDLQSDLGYASDVLAYGTESRRLKESYNSEAFVAYMDDVLTNRTPRSPMPPAPLDEAELEQASLLSTPLKDIVDTNTLKFILGQRDMSEWDAYVGELEARGLQSYVDLINGARERFAQNNG